MLTSEINPNRIIGPDWTNPDAWREYWDNILRKQCSRTQKVDDFFYDHEWLSMGLRITGKRDAVFFQKLSRLFLVKIMHEGTYGAEADRDPAHVLCDWLLATYNAVLMHSCVEPGQAGDNMVRVILDHTLSNVSSDYTNWKPVRVHEDGTIVFAEISRLRIKKQEGHVPIIPEHPTLFPHNIALSKGFASVVAATKAVQDMQSVLRYHKIYPGEKEYAIVNMVRNIHADGQEVLATPEKINSFDFSNYIVRFLMDDKIRLGDTVN